MTLTRFIPAALLTAALAAAPALAADPTPEDLKKSIDRFEKAVKELQELKDALKSDTLREKVATIEATVNLIDNDIKDIKKDLRDLKRKVEGNTSTSLRPEYDSTPLRGQGRVRFINQLSEEMSIVVNGRPFRLSPGAERLLPVPPGEFNYQVLQLQRDVRTLNIAADETKTIRIFPLQ